IYIQHGILVVSRILVPMIRVQHVDTKQGPILRKFNLASVTISTAATTHEIPALIEADASALRDRISTLARVDEDDVRGKPAASDCCAVQFARIGTRSDHRFSRYRIFFFKRRPLALYFICTHFACVYDHHQLFILVSLYIPCRTRGVADRVRYSYSQKALYF